LRFYKIISQNEDRRRPDRISFFQEVLKLCFYAIVPVVYV